MYVAELHSLTEHCNFGSTLNTMLRDRLVCGVNNDSIQKRLLSESALTFEDALKIATSMESATRNALQTREPKEQTYAQDGISQKGLQKI